MIDINKKYRTRDGREVRIYAADKYSGGEVASGHNIYRAGKYHGFLKNVYNNFPLGKIIA